MPQLNIPDYIDTEFLAELASLGASWGTLPSEEPNTVALVFITERLDDVEAALAAYPEAYLAKRKADRLEEVAAIRRVKETHGPSGLTLDLQTIVRLNAAATGLLVDQSRQSVRWEISRGNFVELPRNTVLGLAVASVNKVQACFDTVYEKTQLIQAVSIVEGDLLAALAELNAIDIDSGWPE